MFPEYLKKEFAVLFFLVTKGPTFIDETLKRLLFIKRAVREVMSTIYSHFEERRDIKTFVLSKKMALFIFNLP
jgi:hypothetical protein